MNKFISLTTKQQTTKFWSANFPKKLSPCYIIVRIQRLEVKQCRSRLPDQTVLLGITSSVVIFITLFSFRSRNAYSMAIQHQKQGSYEDWELNWQVSEIQGNHLKSVNGHLSYLPLFSVIVVFYLPA